jgi:hypothetical protein
MKWMKVLLVVAFVLGSTAAATAEPARRVRALLIGLTNDKRLGPGISANLQRVERYVRGLPNFDPKNDLTVLTGDDVTSAKIERAVFALGRRPTDAVFCYFAGHGAYDKRWAAGDPSGGHLFQIPSGDVMRRSLLHWLTYPCANHSGPGPRLVVLVSDTCNVPGVYTYPTETLGSTAPGREPIHSKAFADLLYNQEGIVDVSGSSRGEAGWYTADGGWFTIGFLKTLEQYDKAPAEVDRLLFNKGLFRNVDWKVKADWKQFLKKVSQNAREEFRQRKRLVLAQPEPKDERARETRRKLAAQADQRPQLFQMKVRRAQEPQGEEPGAPAKTAREWPR